MTDEEKSMSYDEALRCKKGAHADSILVEILNAPVEEVEVIGDTWVSNFSGLPMSMFPHSPDIQHLYMREEHVVICVGDVTLVIKASVDVWLDDDYLLLNKILERPDIVHHLKDVARVLSL